MNPTRDARPSPGSPTPAAREQRYDWPLCYDAENEILRRLEAFCQRNRFCRDLSHRMLQETGTHLIDWTDHLILPPEAEPRLRSLGYRVDAGAEAPPSQKALRHPEAMLPRILVDQTRAGPDHTAAVALKVDEVSLFLSAHGLSHEPEGEPLSRFRRVRVGEEGGTWVEAVERRGYAGFLAGDPMPVTTHLRAAELWRTRPRQDANTAGTFHRNLDVLDRLIGMAGTDLACHIVFAEERRYWESRNRAARCQKHRQDRLGLGWANHDHHTFRSSRRHFLPLMQVMERLGFERRERYYAGAEAGWGAQIWEQPVEGIVTFCDVDLHPEETELDFSRQALPESGPLGTIGLWTALHGESFLQAGMHHLECRFDYEKARELLAQEGIPTMKPFSDFPFLKQAFTEGESWPVPPSRIERLRKAGHITAEQAERFGRQGAIGSHLENLQRKGGFKGFNQSSVSAIIAATDPRHRTA